MLMDVLYNIIIAGSSHILYFINRATSYGYMFIPFSRGVKETLDFLVYILHFSRWFILFTLAVIIGAKTYHIVKENHKIYHIGKNQIILILSLILSLAYLILLSSREFPEYIIKGDVMFSYIIFYLLLVLLCLGYLSTRLRAVKLLLPFLIFFFLFVLNTEGNTFKDLQYWNGTDLRTCEKFDHDVIRQMKAAEALGQDTVTIYVHKYNDGSNWPQDISHSQYIGLTLQKHGIIRRKIVTHYERMPEELDTQK